MPGIVLSLSSRGPLEVGTILVPIFPDGKAEAHRERDGEREGKPLAHTTHPGRGTAGRISGMNLMFPETLVILTEPGDFSYSLTT